MEAISPINCHYLTAKQIETLNANNIKTFLDFLSAPSEDVCKILQITDYEYSTIRLPVLQCVQPQPFSLRALSSTDRLTPKSTGISGFDKMLGGGLFPGDIVEFYGKTGSGKTQLCLHLTAQFCHFSEPTSYVIYFDMKNDFNAVRLKMLCDDKIDNLGKVKIFREPNLQGLFARLDEMKNHLTGGINGFYSKTKFVVIDSVPMCIYPAVTQDSYSWRFYPEQLVSRLRWLADKCNIVVILVNHAVTPRNPSNSSGAGSSRRSTSTSGHIKAAMGKFWHHIMHTRVQLSKVDGKLNMFTATLEKSGRTSEGQQFTFSIKRNDKLKEEEAQ